MADVRVFFATNRNHQPGNKKQIFRRTFNPDCVSAIRLGYAEYEPDPKKHQHKTLLVYTDVLNEPDFTRK